MNASSSSNPHSSLFQRTGAAVVELEGPGLLTGEHCRLRLHPAEPGTGRVCVPDPDPCEYQYIGE